MNHCETCGRTISRPTWSECSACRAQRITETAKAETTHVPTRGRICPDCAHRPSRDQRAWQADGRCLKCHDKAHKPKPKPSEQEWAA